MRLVLLAAALALGACAPQPQSYDPAVEMTFMQACESQNQVPGLCACVWDKIEVEVPPADFNALEQLPGAERLAHPLTQQINNYAFACGDELRQAEPAVAP